MRTLLAWLVLACLLPGIIGATTLFIHEYREGHAQLKKDTVQTARALIRAVDNQILRIEALAQGLAVSDSLAAGDLTRFHEQARRTLAYSRLGASVAVADQNGQQIVDTAEKFGKGLPPHGSQELVRQVFETGESAVSNLFESRVMHRPLMAVGVPVLRNGIVVYALTVTVLPETFNDILSAQGLPPGWVATVFDNAGTIAARSRASEEYVGQKPAEGYFRELMKFDEGTFEAVMKDGVPVLAAYTRSPLTNWRLAIGIPREMLTARFTHRLTSLALGIAGLFVAGLGLAWLVGGRIARSFGALAAPAVALGAGEKVVFPALPVKEAAQVARAMEEAARLLEKRDSKIQRLNAELEQRVHLRTLQLEQSNEALMLSNMELQRFAHAAAHDLQTPLRSIVGFSQLLQKELKSCVDERADQWLGLVIDNTRRLQTLIQELLNYSRLDAQAKPFEPVDLGEISERAIAALAPTIAESGAEVVPGPLPTVMGDRSQMVLLLQNLVENGIKYNHSQPPRVTISAERQGREWTVAVADNGIGIDPKYHERIFEIFRRLHSHQQIPGTGIGLAICQRIVERHGGRLWVESRPGEGSTFRFSLPAGDDGQ